MEPALTLTIDRTPPNFRPGESLDGRAEWKHAENIKSAAVRLFWTTSGKGTNDTEIVLAQDFDNPRPDDSRTFSFVLPAGPPGFSGSLITLTWGVELVIEPGELAVHREFVFGPEGWEIRLPRVQSDKTNRKFWMKPA